LRPAISLDANVLAANARAWSEFAGVPVRAVVKCDGYGWGAGAIVRALRGTVQSYCVADADELRALRAHTSAPAIVFGAVPLARFGEVLDAGAQPTISNAQELAAAAQWFGAHSRPLRVRVGIRMAAAWSGLDPADLALFALELRAASAEVEAWTHITDMNDAQRQLSIFENALRELSRAGVRVTESDVCSTFPLAGGIRSGSSVRIGVGLFGATGGPAVPGVACALRFSAPVIRVERHSAGTRIGYGGTMLGMDCTVAILRSGFGDGLPASIEGKNGVLMAGMQYSAVRADALGPDAREYLWLDRHADLDDFARAAGRPVHEIVTQLGSCARAAMLEETV
jgi:alanine racemase